MGYRDDYFNDEKNKSNNGWYTCVRCGKKLRKSDAEIDHILPQSLGGTNSIDNLQVMCKSCNCSKGNGIDGTIDDYKNNSIRREPPSNADVKELEKALSKGIMALLKWAKK